MAIFSKTGRVSFNPRNSGRNGSSQFGGLTWASNFIWLKAFLDLVFLMKVVILCLAFPMTQKSGHLNLSRGSYSHMNIYCSFGQFFGFSVWIFELGQ